MIAAGPIVTAIEKLATERNELQRQLDNANRINQEMADAATRLEKENAKLRTQTAQALTTQLLQAAWAVIDANLVPRETGR